MPSLSLTVHVPNSLPIQVNLTSKYLLSLSLFTSTANMFSVSGHCLSWLSFAYVLLLIAPSVVLFICNEMIISIYCPNDFVTFLLTICFQSEE